MNTNPLILLGVSLIGLLGFGILLFVGLRMWNEERDSKPGDSVAAQPDKGRAEPRAPFGGRFGARPKAEANSHEVLRLLRENLTGRLLVEMAGQRYAKLADIPDSNLQRAVLTALRDLQNFADAAPTPASALASPPAEAPRRTESIEPNTLTSTASTPTPPPTARPEMPKPAPPIIPPAGSADVPEPPPLQRPSMNPLKQMRVLREIEKRPQPQLKSIPEHIDEFLQQKLLGTPYIWRGIRVRASAAGTVEFEADGKTYESVDEVPDPEVRALIRAAVAEWEKTR